MEIIKQMKLLVNDKELANYLCSLIDIKDQCSQIKIDESNESNVSQSIGYILEKKHHHKFSIEKYRDKFKQKIRQGVTKDIQIWRSQINEVVTRYRKYHFRNIHTRIDYLLDRLNQDQVIDRYLKSDVDYFIKTVGLQIDPAAKMIRRKHFIDANEDCLLRNTVGNENVIVDKIDKNLPFWFIDSGYTNFIEPNKKWHRLVRNHLHFNQRFVAPADRMGLFKSFPQPWRKDGSAILIVEPGEFAANIMHVEAKSWGEQVATELRKYTDRPIEFRSKTNKKTRTSLYQQLKQGDYYCTVSINSNSAVESIWAGVPAITLNKHVSNMVTRNSLSDINDLYYGPLGDWLAWLSYCQFTFDELMDGTALRIVRQYHNV
jgi:hypothetical protein